jgi:hypothetical protein
MKKRIHRVLNFLAFNLLFFALYLNFIHKDSNQTELAPRKSPTAAVQKTVLVSNPEQYLKDVKQPAVTTASLQESDKKVSFN